MEPSQRRKVSDSPSKVVGSIHDIHNVVQLDQYREAKRSPRPCSRRGRAASTCPSTASPANIVVVSELSTSLQQSTLPCIVRAELCPATCGQPALEGKMPLVVIFILIFKRCQLFEHRASGGGSVVPTFNARKELRGFRGRITKGNNDVGVGRPGSTPFTFSQAWLRPTALLRAYAGRAGRATGLQHSTIMERRSRVMMMADKRSSSRCSIPSHGTGICVTAVSVSMQRARGEG